jgi:hypothetical protein
MIAEVTQNWLFGELAVGVPSGLPVQIGERGFRLHDDVTGRW